MQHRKQALIVLTALCNAAISPVVGLSSCTSGGLLSASNPLTSSVVAAVALGAAVPEYFDMHKAFPDATAISYDSAGSIDISSGGVYAPGSINIITELGPFTTHFLGSCRWLREGAFAYSINKIRIDFGGRSLTIPMPVKLENELDFFLVTDELACARSKLGGTMLLEANPSRGRKYFDTW